MIRAFVNLICFFMLFQFGLRFAYAETCPSINEIKKKLPHGWELYDSEDGKVLSDARKAKFKENVKQFALAEWQAVGKMGGKTNDDSTTNARDPVMDGRIHCYYRDLSGSDLEVYVAKAHYIPNNAQNFWYQVSGSMHCAAGSSRCLFSVSAKDLKVAQRARTATIYPYDASKK